MNLRTLIVLSLSLTVFAQEHDHTHENHAAHEDSSGIEGLMLNGDQKWDVNEATQVGMTQIDQHVKAFKAAPSSDIGALKTKIDGEIQTIVSRCDMTGKAHDQLHLVLIPLMEEVKGLAHADHSAKHLAAIEKTLATYFSHFQGPSAKK